MDQREKVGSVEYATVEAAYFEKRGLRKYARPLHLWALGVGAVIAGDFSGWNFGLSAGFGGLLIATAIITVMYFCLCFSIAEMSPALPHTGGAYSFARSSMGPWGGFITGLAENMEYILTPAVIVYFAGSYLAEIFHTAPGYAPLWWIGAYVVFVGLNILGTAISFRFSVFITILALLILTVFYVGALPHFDLEKYALASAPDTAGSRWLPKGWVGVMNALPFAIWFYLAIEELPLAAEESFDPRKDMPKGILLGMVTLTFTAFLTLVLNTGIAPGAFNLSTSNAPLLDGFKTIFGDGVGARALALIAVAGLIASLHTIIFAFGRQIYSLSRAGYFPRFLSLTHATRHTPHVALVTGGLLGLAALLTIHLLAPENREQLVGGMLLNMAVFGAVISYILQMLSFILLRIRFPAIQRPYVSPLGIPGAVVALLISAVTLVTLFYSDPIYQKVVIGAAIWYALGLLYFALYGRKHLVKSPEEEFALRSGESERTGERSR
jgi:ethanolamine permease